MKSFLKICVVISSILSVLGSVNNNGNTVSDNSDILNFFETLNEKKGTETTETEIELNNTYTTRMRAEWSVSCPTFSFDYSDDWHITQEQLEVNGESDILENNRGVKLMYSTFDQGSPFYGGAYYMEYATVTKMADVNFVPGYPEGCATDFSSLGKMCVAEIKVYAYENGETDDGQVYIDGETYYAVVPESYIGETLFKGLGYYAACSWDYPRSHLFIAEAPKGKFTDKEKEEVIMILSSFREA